jgi:hypothetical protein
MITEYFTRLICLSLAAFFAVHLLTSLAIWRVTPMAACVAGRLRPRLAARILLAMRFVPVASGLFVVAALCVPSYLELEPGEGVEAVGWPGVVAAAMAIAIWGNAIFRGLRTVLRSRQLIKRRVPLFALTGIIRPRLLVAPAIRRSLTRDQLRVALHHERAHGLAWDNGKRLLLAFAPGLLPGVHGVTALERHWSRFTEWAADDDAIQGDPERSLALAGALVRIARMGSVALPLASGLLDGDGLTERVDRLLNPAAPEPWDAQPMVITAAAALTVVASCAGLALRPASLESAHRLLEHLIC